MALRFIFLIFLSLSLTRTVIAQTIPTPTQTGTIIIDNGASGKADPNDRIRYKVTIQNTGAASGTGVQLNIVPDPRTTFAPGTFRSSPLAVPDAYACTGNVGLVVPAASGLKVNDFDDDVAGLTCTAGTFATTQSGSITIAADGSFTYTPPAGFTGSDTYTYTLNDGNAVSGVTATDNALITFTVSNLIWFVDNTGGGSGGAGTLTSPFKTLAAFNGSAGPAAGHTIFIKNSGTNYTGGIILKNNQILIGEGHTGTAAPSENLSVALSFTLAPNSAALPNIDGTRPVITNSSGDGVTLASDNSLRGFDIGACSDFGIDNTATISIGNLILNEVSINNTTGGGFDAGDGSGNSMNAVFGGISSTGGTNGINLVNCGGTITVNGGNITNPTGTGVLISGGTVTFSSSGNVSDNSGFAVDIDNHDSGNVTLSGQITSTGGGIRVQNCAGGTKLFSGTLKTFNTGTNNAVTLSNNTGATINFINGAMVITTTSGAGFSATGGGTVTVQGTGNTITSGSGAALNVANTTIGAGNLTFLSISANGGTNGIVLNTTGTSGGLNVTGIGTTNGSGGTIQNISARGVSATSTQNLSLKNITFTNANTVDGGTCNASDNSGCNAAIHLNTVTNVTLDNVDINGTTEQGINVRNSSGFKLLNSTLINCGVASSGTDLEESCLYAVNMSGTCEITSSSLTVPNDRAAVIYNTNQTLALTVTGSTFGMTQALAFGADGLEVENLGAGNLTLDIVNSHFPQPKTNGLQVITDGTSFSRVDLTGSDFDPGAGLSAAIDLVTNGSGDMDFNIINNQIKSRGINAVNIFGFSGSKFEGRINDNTVNVGDGSGSGVAVRITAQGNLNNVVEIKNNNITGANDYGITCVTSLGTGRLDATITGNRVSVSNTGAYCIQVAAGVSSTTTTNTVCANVSGNSTAAPGAPSGAIGDFQARAVALSNSVLLQGNGSDVATYWSGNSNLSYSSNTFTPPTITAHTSQSGLGSFTFGVSPTVTCAIPANPLP